MSNMSARLRTAKSSRPSNEPKNLVTQKSSAPKPFADLEPVLEATPMGACQRIFLSICLITFFGLMTLVFQPSIIQPQLVHLPVQPDSVGPLAFNLRLAEAEKLWLKKLRGPESFVFIDGFVYTGTLDGIIWKMRLNETKSEPQMLVRVGDSNCEFMSECGRPLGLRKHPKFEHLLVVADAFHGLLTVDTQTGEMKQLIGRESAVGVTLFNDLDISADGAHIFVSDSSTRFPLPKLMLDVLEMRGSGRLIQYDTTSGQSHVLMKGLGFANGVQLHPDGISILVVETFLMRIQRYYFAGPLAGQSTIFAQNLPVLPDNIRLSPDSTSLWVSSAGTRFAGQWSVMDMLAARPWARLLIAKMAPLSLFQQVADFKKHGVALRLNVWNGDVIESLHDPQGLRVAQISEINEFDGHIYMGSYHSDFVAKLKL